MLVVPGKPERMIMVKSWAFYNQPSEYTTYYTDIDKVLKFQIPTRIERVKVYLIEGYVKIANPCFQNEQRSCFWQAV